MDSLTPPVPILVEEVNHMLLALFRELFRLRRPSIRRDSPLGAAHGLDG